MIAIAQQELRSSRAAGWRRERGGGMDEIQHQWRSVYTYRQAWGSSLKNGVVHLYDFNSESVYTLWMRPRSSRTWLEFSLRSQPSPTSPLSVSALRSRLPSSWTISSCVTTDDPLSPSQSFLSSAGSPTLTHYPVAEWWTETAPPTFLPDTLDFHRFPSSFSQPFYSVVAAPRTGPSAPRCKCLACLNSLWDNLVKQVGHPPLNEIIANLLHGGSTPQSQL